MNQSEWSYSLKSIRWNFFLNFFGVFVTRAQVCHPRFKDGQKNINCLQRCKKALKDPKIYSKRIKDFCISGSRVLICTSSDSWLRGSTYDLSFKKIPHCKKHFFTNYNTQLGWSWKISKVDAKGRWKFFDIFYISDPTCLDKRGQFE